MLCFRDRCEITVFCTVNLIMLAYVEYEHAYLSIIFEKCDVLVNAHCTVCICIHVYVCESA